MFNSGDLTGDVTVRMELVGSDLAPVDKTIAVGKAESDLDALPIGSDKRGEPIVRLHLKFNDLPVNGHPISWKIKALSNFLGEVVPRAKWDKFANISGNISTTGTSPDRPGEATAYVALKAGFGRVKFSAKDNLVQNLALASASRSAVATSAAANEQGLDIEGDGNEKQAEVNVVEGSTEPKTKPLTKPLSAPPASGVVEEFLEGGTIDDPDFTRYKPDQYEMISIKTQLRNDVEIPQTIEVAEFTPEGRRVGTRKITDEERIRILVRGFLEAKNGKSQSKLSQSAIRKAMGEPTESGNFFVVLLDDYASGRVQKRLGYLADGIIYGIGNAAVGTGEFFLYPDQTLASIKAIADPKQRAAAAKEFEAWKVKMEKSLTTDGFYASGQIGAIAGNVEFVVISQAALTQVGRFAAASKLAQKLKVPLVVIKQSGKATVFRRVRFVTQGLAQIQKAGLLPRAFRSTSMAVKSAQGTTQRWVGAILPRPFALNALKNGAAKVFPCDSKAALWALDIKQKTPFAKIYQNGKTYSCNRARIFFDRYGNVKTMKLLKWIPRCFVAGTPILMGDGTHKAIEQIKAGDLVMSRDEATGATSVQKVVQTFERQAEATLVLRFTNGEIIEATEEHPFFVESQGFTVAKLLRIGSLIATLNSAPTKVKAVSFVEKTVPVYNFKVQKTLWFSAWTLSSAQFAIEFGDLERAVVDVKARFNR